MMISCEHMLFKPSVCVEEPIRIKMAYGRGTEGGNKTQYKINEDYLQP